MKYHEKAEATTSRKIDNKGRLSWAGKRYTSTRIAGWRGTTVRVHSNRFGEIVGIWSAEEGEYLATVDGSRGDTLVEVTA